MKIHIFSILAVIAVSACDPLADDVPGKVVSYTDTMVVIESAEAGWNSADYDRPTQAMQVQAQELCASRQRSAKFLNAEMVDGGSRTIIGPQGTSYVSGSSNAGSLQYRFACI